MMVLRKPLQAATVIVAASVACLFMASPATLAGTGDLTLPQPDSIPEPAEGKAKSDNQFAEFTRAFEEAIRSLDETNKELEAALGQQPYDQVLDLVDDLLNHARDLAERLQPGNVTEQKIDRLINQIDSQIARIAADGALPPEDREAQIDRLRTIKDRYAKARADLSATYQNVSRLADELKGRRRSVAYDFVNKAYEKGVASLEDTILKINDAVEGLRGKLIDIRPTLTN